MQNWTKEQALAYLNDNTSINLRTGCHEWHGPITADGYGQIGPDGLYSAYRIKGAHRLVYALHNDHQFTSRHEQVMHDCDNRRCVNPDHLTLGDAATNIAHAAEIGSMKRGEDHCRAVLTEIEVREVKSLMADGWRNCMISQIMPQVTQVMASQIRTGRSWRHVVI